MRLVGALAASRAEEELRVMETVSGYATSKRVELGQLGQNFPPAVFLAEEVKGQERGNAA